ncbi:radical SAM/SPASM domain-containing protein [Paenibacillus senegalimassiliensis]|uniref:radical SAM/SPASM domain-containing protein n=1 Tax=Paenibacillus senegalimassiliensis TaxID=1737426 RepID=UPI00073F1399|nr:radical SAM protein [Paenibacillus senegalimassiliensis]
MTNSVVRKPFYADFSVTSRCNLNCDFCSASAPDIKNNINFLELSDIDRIFMQLDELEVMRVSLEGGEPFLRSDFLEIMKLADKYDFEYYVNTNATLINKEIAKQISETNVSKICISIDGPDESIHDKCRGQLGAFNKTVKAIRNLHEFNIPVDGIITLTKYNAPYVLETIQFIAEMGIENVAIMLLASVGNASENFSDVYLDFDEWSAILLELTTLKKNHALPVNLNIVSTGESKCPWELYLPLLNNGREDDIDVWIRNDAETTFDEHEFFCTAGKDNLAIDGKGNVYGCSLMISENELSAGNLLDKSLLEIWNYSEIFNLFRTASINNITGACRNCDLLNKCGGGCRACAFAMNKSIYHSDTRCPKGVLV